MINIYGDNGAINSKVLDNGFPISVKFTDTNTDTNIIFNLLYNLHISFF